jgi:small ligand-binding sensory domain FIST
MTAAASFAALSTDAAALVRPLLEARARVAAPSCGLVFATGGLGRELVSVGQAVASAWPGTSAIIGAGAGVMTERGEYEGQSAGAGLLTGGIRSAAFAVAATSAGEIERALGAEVDRLAGGRAATLILLARPAGWSPSLLASLSATRPELRVLGGGTSDEAGPVVVEASGRVRQGQVAGLLLMGTAPPRVAVSPGCRLLGQPSVVTGSKGGMILTLDGEPALDVLTRATQRLEGRPLVVTMLADGASSPDAARQVLLRSGRVRPIRGVDPGRRGLVLGEPVAEGALVGFAALEGGAARGNLELALRDLSRATAGAAARFGLYFNCAGRGAALYGADHVDSKLLRARFERLPIVGMMSSFEIAPSPERAAVHYYTGVFGLFTAPS